MPPIIVFIYLISSANSKVIPPADGRNIICKHFRSFVSRQGVPRLSFQCGDNGFNIFNAALDGSERTVAQIG
jgi:hypothetical protein